MSPSGSTVDGARVPSVLALFSCDQLEASIGHDY
jgi:hypothetical protein